MPWYVRCLLAVSLSILMMMLAIYLNYIFCLPQDNLMEETVEEIVEDLIGLEIDLSPEISK